MTNETESYFLGLAEQFEAERPRLRAVALRMLGSDAGADDAVQEAWIRLVRTDARSKEGGEEIENLPGWLTTVVSRICLDALRSRPTRPTSSTRRLPPRTRPSSPTPSARR